MIKAKEQLQITIRNLEQLVEDTMTVDPKHYRHFVARRGEVLHQIMEQYGGVTISLPRSNVQSDQVIFLSSVKNGNLFKVVNVAKNFCSQCIIQYESKKSWVLFATLNLFLC